MEAQTALQKAAQLCSRSEKCEADIREKLQTWKLDAALHNEVLKQLIDDNFINHRRYAYAFVREKFELQAWGRSKISYMLRAKSIEEYIISEALETIDDQQYESSLKQQLEKKERSIKYKNDLERKAKLTRFALSRGFETDLVYRLVGRQDD